MARAGSENDGRQGEDHPRVLPLNKTRVLTLLLAVLLAFGGAAADEQDKLSRRDRKDRIAKLGEQHRQFLIDVEPIIQPFERDAFLKLETDAQRDSFIEDFWRRRDIARGTTNHAARREYYDRLEFVRENFESISSDRGKIYLVQGPPLGMIDVKCSKYVQPIQIWGYAFIPDLGHEVRLLFYLPRNMREFRLWDPFTEGVLALRSDTIDATHSQWTAQDVIMGCAQGEALVAAIASMQSDQYKLSSVFKPPPVSEEDVGKILRSAVLVDPKAPKLAAEMTVAYPSAQGMKTDAQITIQIPRAQLKTTTAGGVSVYTIDVVGEVLRNDAMWERYRYRFDFPGDIKDEKLPIVIDRLLRPAAYKSRIKITDAATNAQAILESDLTVPEVAAKPTVESETLTTIREELQSTRASLRIVPLPESVMSGLQTIQTIV